jgi:hypothetical protein
MDQCRLAKISVPLLVAAMACTLCVGCGQKSNVVPVSGRVIVDGKPLANVAVNFGPLTGGLDAAWASYGKTDEQGRYTLKLVEGGQLGGMIGANRVTLNESSPGAESDGAAVRVQFKLPPTARDGTLRFEVPAGGTDAANFEFGKGAGKS